MSESNEEAEAPIGGRRYLWIQPELLSVEAHGDLGLTPSDAPFAFTATSRGMPLTLGEFRSAQRHFPIVFTDADNPVPLAAIGLKEERNLFLDAEGRWDERVYMPAYLRSHPFALAKAAEDRYALVIDRAAPAISKNPEVPFFENGELTEPVRKAIDFCQAYDAETERTREFCARLKELDLLTPQRMRRDGAEEDMVRYFAVSVEKLDKLPADVVEDLFRRGYMAVIFAHLFSLEMWNELLRRENRT
ncbi:MAG TPA: SapC family protein [Pseudomonadales bacterium]|nr:SapC family protein [Pseudomonadales bacterium]